MLGEQWLPGVMLAVAAVHLLALVFLVRLGGVADGADRPRSDGPAVECPSCGADNGTEYRFCRRCVAELPGGLAGGGGSGAPRRRWLL